MIGYLSYLVLDLAMGIRLSKSSFLKVKVNLKKSPTASILMFTK